jgi:hypothetical protein
MTIETVSTSRANAILGLYAPSKELSEFLAKFGIEPVFEDERGFLRWRESDILLAKQKMNDFGSSSKNTHNLELSELLETVALLKKQNVEIFKKVAEKSEVKVQLSEKDFSRLSCALTNQLDTALNSVDKRLDSFDQKLSNLLSTIKSYGSIIGDLKTSIAEVASMQRALVTAGNAKNDASSANLSKSLTRLEQAFDQNFENLSRSIGTTIYRGVKAALSEELIDGKEVL